MIRTYLELMLATLIWGFAYITSVWVLKDIGPVLTTALRFGAAAIFIDLLFRLKLLRNLKPLQYQLSEFLLILKPAFFLFMMLTLQTWGLRYTSPTRSGFISVLYVLLVPFFEHYLIGTKIRPVLGIFILMALLGTSLICGVITTHGIDQSVFTAINFGDMLTLLCTVFAAAYIVGVNQTLARVDSAIKFHVYQCVWIAGLASFTAFFTEGFGALAQPWGTKVWLGLFHLGIISSGLAFLIQIRAQKKILPTSLGLLVLLQSPWALIFSVLLGMEQLSLLQITGAGFILLAAVFECLSTSRL